MLRIVHDKLPELYAFVNMFYAHLSLLDFGVYTTVRRGFQQADPLGLLLFCVSSMKLACSMTSEFISWCFDDESLSDVVSSLLTDLVVVRRFGPTIGIQLNQEECEIITTTNPLSQLSGQYCLVFDIFRVVMLLYWALQSATGHQLTRYSTISW